MEVMKIPAHVTNYTVGRSGKIDRVVLHYTGADGSAEDNGRYFAGEEREASAHYFVDEKQAIASVPEQDTAWHAGNWEMNCRSIGVEMCCRKDSKGKWFVPDAVLEKTVELVRDIMQRYCISVDGVIRHYDVTKKNCPAPMVENPVLWANFKRRLTERDLSDGTMWASSPTGAEEPAAWAKEAWEKAKARGVLDGTRPADPVTRQELAVVLARLGLV